MSFERLKKPVAPIRRELEKPKNQVANQTKTPVVAQTPEQLQRAKTKLEHDGALLEVQRVQAKAQRQAQAVLDEEARVQRQAIQAVQQEQHTRVQRALDVQAKQQAFHSSFVKSPVQRKSLENIKTSSIQTSETRAQYQADITPEIVQRFVNNKMTASIQAARAEQQLNALNSRTDWFNTELPVLRAKHNNPDKPELDSSSVFNPKDEQAKTLGKVFMRERLSSGLTPKDAAGAVLSIQNSWDRSHALKGLLNAIPPNNSDYSSIQRLVVAGEQEHELQRQGLLESDGLQRQAFQLAKDEANPTTPNSGISEKINAKRGAGNPLPENIRKQLEAGLNTNLEAVRVHTDGEADKLAKSVNAIAFTTGKDIFFSSGSYNPNTKTGYELIAHEVTHTVQQASGQVKPGIDQDSSLESQAQSKGAELALRFDPNVKYKNLETVGQTKAPLTSNEATLQRVAAKFSVPIQRDATKPKLDVNKLNGGQKLFEAIKLAPMAESVKQQLLNAISPQSLGLFALVFGAGAVAQATPVGWAADLIIAGLLAWGFWSVGSIIFEVIKDFAAFTTTALNAKSEADLTRAGKHFSNAIAMIGVNVVIAMVAHTAAKGVNAKLKASAAQRKAVTAQQIQAKLNAQKPKANSSQPNTPASTLVASGVLTPEFIKAFKSEPIARNAVTTYSTFPNWAEIQPIIGKAMSSSTVPKGYLYATIEGKEYYYLPGADKSKVPVVESNAKGNAYLPSEPSYRVANQPRYTRNYSDKVLDSGSQIHHLIADNIWRKFDVFQETLRRGIGSMDEKSNLIELAEKPADLARAKLIDPKFPDVLHQSNHFAFDALVEQRIQITLQAQKRVLRRPVEQWTNAELLDFIRKIEHEIRNLFINHPDQLPKKANGTLGFAPNEKTTGEA